MKTEELLKQTLDGIKELMEKDPVHGQEILSAIADQYGQIAEHVRSNWQDDPLAMTWDICGMKVDNTIGFIIKKTGA